MIAITRKDNPVFVDFVNKSGYYSCPSVALAAFATVCEAYGYHLEYTIAANTLHDSVLVDIFKDDERVAYAHIAWCRYPNGRYSCIGRIVR